MPTLDFNKLAIEQQYAWRMRLSDVPAGDGTLPRDQWEENLWPGIRSGSDNSLPAYLKGKEAERFARDELCDLKSSWILCANLYFPFRAHFEWIKLFLQQHVDAEIAVVESVEMCYSEPKVCDPSKVLGEPTRGSGLQGPTMPDLGVRIRLDGGQRGLILMDCTYAEQSFKDCSGHKKTSGNPHPEVCLDFATLYPDLLDQCWQMNWENDHRRNRRYWEQIHLSPMGEETLRQCPAASGGYQLFRMQALAEGFAWRRNMYQRVILCIAHDDRNVLLRHSLHKIGIDDFTTDWEPLFEGKSTFKTWTHQRWVQWVREHDTSGLWRDWSAYVSDRYGL
jgi:hypothetical protein